MAFSRVAALRSAIRGARPSVAARPQCFRQIVRRGYASGHGSAQAGGDTMWAIGAVAVTIPSCWYLLSNNPEPAHGHGDHGDSHGKGHKEEHEEESEEDTKEESTEESDDKEAGDSNDKDSEKSTDSDSGDEKDEADTPETSDDEGESESKEGDNTKKHIPDAKGGAKKRIESNNAVTAGQSDESDDKSAPSKPTGGPNSQSSKQEGLTNTDTKHSTDISNDPTKSKKAEGGPDTAKVKGTVQVDRKQV